MEKDYEIIQNISLAEKKEQEAPAASVVPEVVVNVPGAEPVASPVIANPEVSEPQIVVTPPVEEAPAVAIPDVQLEIPGVTPAPVEPEVVPVVEETAPVYETPVEEPVTVEPVYEEPTYEVPEYNYGDNTSTDEYTSMFANTEVEEPTYNAYDNNYNDGYANTYTEVPAYDSSVSVDVNVDVNFKDEDSINNYYDRKRAYLINEIEKERAAALDQCKKYNEMASWVNDIGSSFNFFKGRSGY